MRRVLLLFAYVFVVALSAFAAAHLLYFFEFRIQVDAALISYVVLPTAVSLVAFSAVGVDRDTVHSSMPVACGLLGVAVVVATAVSYLLAYTAGWANDIPGLFPLFQFVIALLCLVGSRTLMRRRSNGPVPVAVRRVDPLVDATGHPRTVMHISKRAVDVAASATLILLLSPIAGIIALFLVIEDGFPVFFSQMRVGRLGAPFRLFKFRTMIRAGEEAEHAGTRSRPVGEFLRRTRLDELPQLISILRGDMSFVGPRPLLPCDQPDDPGARRVRHQVRPGLTGWAQVHGGRMLSREKKGARDVWYVENMSLGLDLRILAKTLPVVWHGDEKSVARAEAMGPVGRRADHRPHHSTMQDKREPAPVRRTATMA